MAEAFSAYGINDFEQEMFALMKTEQSVGNRVRDLLSKSYSLKQLDIGADARLAKKGFTFETESYDAVNRAVTRQAFSASCG